MRRTGMIMSCVFTIVGALIALFVWNGGDGSDSSLAQASTGELLAVLGLFVVPPLTFVVMIAEQHYAGRSRVD